MIVLNFNRRLPLLWEQQAFVREDPAPAPKTHPEHDFSALVGAAGWARLAPAIRARFDARATARPVTYKGQMEAVRCSRLGFLLAQLCRLVGTPLAPFQGEDVPITAHVFEAPDGSGIVWKRIYEFPGKTPIAVQSTKVFADNNQLLECVGGGFGMRLNVFEEDGKLHFLSTDYFWRLGRISIRLPHLLTPGRAHVIHTDEGAGRFRFTMTMVHPLLGEMFFQDGVFSDEE